MKAGNEIKWHRELGKIKKKQVKRLFHCRLFYVSFLSMRFSFLAWDRLLITFLLAFSLSQLEFLAHFFLFQFVLNNFEWYPIVRCKKIIIRKQEIFKISTNGKARGKKTLNWFTGTKFSWKIEIKRWNFNGKQLKDP